MIVFDLALSAVTGQSLAMAAKKQLKEEESLIFNKSLLFSYLWMSLIYTPTGIAMYHGWTPWNSSYFFDPFPVAFNQPGYMSAFICWLDALMMNLIFLASFILGHKWIRQNREKRIWILCFTAAGIVFLFWALFFQRNFTVTTFDQFIQLPREGIVFRWGGNSFFGHPISWIILLMGLYSFIPFGILFHYLRKKPQLFT